RTWRWCRATPPPCWWHRWAAFTEYSHRPCRGWAAHRQHLGAFPEEVNRRLATPLVTLHFAPTQAARAAVLREAVPEETISATGNTVLLLDPARVGQQQPATRHECHEVAVAQMCDEPDV